MSSDAPNTPPAEPASPGDSTAPTESAATTESASRYRTRSGGRSHSGTAVVARGESMVWLTAGSLAVCIVMVIGLISLVVVRGLTTFWPVPVVRLVLADGTVYLGEVTSSDERELTEASIKDVPEQFLDRAQEALGDQASVRTKRRKLRTEITKDHFNDVDEFTIVSEEQPEWAAVFERLTETRMYGTPVRLEVHYPREPSGEEKRLVELLNFFTPYNLSSLDEAERKTAEEALGELRTKLAETQAMGVAAFRTRLPDLVSDGRLMAVVEDGDPVPWTEYDDTGNLLEVVEIWDEVGEAWSRFEALHPERLSRYRERRSIEKHDQGRVNRIQEAARLRVREAEIEAEMGLLAPLTQIGALETEARGYRKAIDDNDGMAERVKKVLGPESPLVPAAEKIAEFVNATFRADLEKLDEKRDNARAGLEERIAKVDDPAAVERARSDFAETQEKTTELSIELRERIDVIKAENDRFVLVVRKAERKVDAEGEIETPGEEVSLALRDIVRAYTPNRLSSGEKWSVYWSRWGEFLTDDPRFANQEGGVFPAIWGTVAMTIIMSLAVVPFGVLAALYLREYAKAGPIVSAVRIAVNNLAGVPSIVFGVFGLGFFCYIIGAYIDGGARNAGIEPLAADSWSSGWYLLLLGLAVVAVAAFMLGIASASGGPAAGGSAWKRIAGRLSFACWIVATVILVVLILRAPEFTGFYRAKLPNPTFGKGGLMWASFTLALLTLPVVIVATEEALAAVPNSMREGSYACGASKWQTIQRIVLPRAMPGITTGMILAMARGAGEVAPLMLVGALKLAPELPIDGVAPFVHLDRSFMHLGFHIFDLGFQSQNSEAAKPMVFTTTLLLIGIVAFLNVAAIVLRARLRRRFKGSQF